MFILFPIGDLFFFFYILYIRKRVFPFPIRTRSRIIVLTQTCPFRHGEDKNRNTGQNESAGNNGFHGSREKLPIVRCTEKRGSGFGEKRLQPFMGDPSKYSHAENNGPIRVASSYRLTSDAIQRRRRRSHCPFSACRCFLQRRSSSLRPSR